MKRVWITLLMVAGALSLAGCGGDAVGPPTVYLGQDVCDECGMIISDERFVAALLVEDEAGRRETRLFDDIGCLVKDEASHPDGASAARYVKSFDQRRWLTLSEAVFVHSEQLQSPMAFGAAAVADRAAAASLQNEVGGDVLTYDALRRALRDEGVAGSGHAHAPIADE
ncbi:MAG: nitrous oxide reductase accessory protein NosL [Phycisphaeraceae bacterium]